MGAEVKKQWKQKQKQNKTKQKTTVPMISILLITTEVETLMSALYASCSYIPLQNYRNSKANSLSFAVH